MDVTIVQTTYLVPTRNLFQLHRTTRWGEIILFMSYGICHVTPLWNKTHPSFKRRQHALSYFRQILWSTPKLQSSLDREVTYMKVEISFTPIGQRIADKVIYFCGKVVCSYSQLYTKLTRSYQQSYPRYGISSKFFYSLQNVCYYCTDHLPSFK